MEEQVSGFEDLAKNIKTLIDKQDQFEKDQQILQAKNIDNEETLRQMKARAGRNIAGRVEERKLSDVVFDEIGKQAEGFKKLANREIKELNFSLKAAPIDMLPSGISGGVVTQSQIQPGIVQIPPRPVHLREVFPHRPLSTAYLAYLKELSTDGGISAVRAGSTKPQLSMNLAEVSTKAQVLAGWVRVSTQMMDDIPYLQSYLSYRLTEQLLTKEDDEILNGDGFDPNLSGILLSGNHTAKTGSATIFVEKLIEACAQLAGYGRRASAIIVNPIDYFAMTTLKAVTSGDYTNPVVIQITPSGGITLLGIPVIWSAAITSGNYLVGDFTNGSALWFRQTPTIQAFFEDSTNVRDNMVTIRIEERIAMPIYSALAFIYPT